MSMARELAAVPTFSTKSALPAQLLFMQTAHGLGAERRSGWAFVAIIACTKRNSMLSRSRASQCRVGCHVRPARSALMPIGAV